MYNQSTAIQTVYLRVEIQKEHIDYAEQHRPAGLIIYEAL